MFLKCNHIKYPDCCKKYILVLGYKDAVNLEVSEQKAFLYHGMLPAAVQVTRQVCNHKNGLLLLKAICFSSMGDNESSTLHFRGTF